MFRFLTNTYSLSFLALVLALYVRSLVADTQGAVSTEDEERTKSRELGESAEPSKKSLWVDPLGYLIYCPCMGRFGNQAQQFLGSLGFAKKLNRTLIIPPWRASKNIPFDEYFRVEAVQQYHRAILAETFMETLAPTVWPVGKRIGFCWMPEGYYHCPMKEGDPFGPFWDGLGVDFDDTIVYRFMRSEVDQWAINYPPQEYPVIALQGAPSNFPVEEQYVPLHKYLQWSEAMEAQANSYINRTFPGEKFVGIHLRNGPDWKHMCKEIGEMKTTSYMSSPQCLGYHSQTIISTTLCLPQTHTVLRQTKDAVELVDATVVYVATDKNPLVTELQKELGKKVRVIHHDPWLPQVDLIILGKADHFIGNCISSFSAFVSRERQVNNKATSFWNFIS